MTRRVRSAGGARAVGTGGPEDEPAGRSQRPARDRGTDSRARRNDKPHPLPCRNPRAGAGELPQLGAGVSGSLTARTFSVGAMPSGHSSTALSGE
jgi:hypothetical protein